MSAQQPKQDNKDALIQLCKAAGDPLRMDILLALSRDSYGVLELAEAFSVKQSGMSHHLKILANADLVSSRREGNSIFYRQKNTSIDDPLREIKDSLFGSLAPHTLDQDLQSRINDLHEARARISHQFFIENAEKFRAQQDLIASYPIYGDQVTDILRNLPAAPGGQAIEVGPGEGELIPFLSARFKQVTALDNSPAMLAKVKLLAEDKALDNVTFDCSDITEIGEQRLRYDCAVANMVLHHIPSPRQVFIDIFPALRPGGHFLITELCHHNQDWVKEACGDLWLGFDPEDLKAWATETGFSHEKSTYFALRNGFQIQIQLFSKPHDKQQYTQP